MKLKLSLALVVALGCSCTTPAPEPTVAEAPPAAAAEPSTVEQDRAAKAVASYEPGSTPEAKVLLDFPRECKAGALCMLECQQLHSSAGDSTLCTIGVPFVHEGRGSPKWSVIFVDATLVSVGPP